MMDTSLLPDDRYELLGELATGGMATVYLARMRRPMGFSRLVAVKCMHPQYAKDPSFATMFVDEARLTARLRHPNIVPTLDIASGAGQLVLVMEYVEGESLSALLRLVREAGERVPPAIACAIAHDALLGLHAAHEAKDDDGAPLAIIHRDVSPQNVIVGFDGLSRVLDFGVAKARGTLHHSADGEIKGKVPYMPPEQLFGDPLDRRVDVYAAGVLLWETLAGARLFEGPTEEVLVRQIAGGEIPAPSTRASGVSPELDALVLRALAREPGERFATALEMAEQISAIAPLPPRTEISAWVARFATRRALPAAPADRADPVVTTLDRAATARSSRPSLPSGVTIPAQVAAPRASGSRMFVAFGAAAVLLAGLAVSRSSASAPSAARVARATEPTASVVLAAARAEQRQGAKAHAKAESKAEAPVEAQGHAKAHAKAGANAKVRVKARAVRARKVERAATRGGLEDATQAVAPEVDCRLPYVVDGQGHRHYKVECL